MASLKVPAFRTWSQVRVVRLAGREVTSVDLQVKVRLSEEERLTAECCDGRVDRLHEDALAMELSGIRQP